jgi:hypothetical protein
MPAPVVTNDRGLVAKSGYTMSSSPAASCAIVLVSCRVRQHKSDAARDERCE